MKDHGTFLSPEELDFIVANNNKKRFAFSDDKSLIRASQGHSVDIDLGYTEQQPPAYYIMVRLLVLSTRYLQAVSTSAAGIMCT
jgi:RNA:NAD 2'-phosphotransferase (TPT1/KptA family)